MDNLSSIFNELFDELDSLTGTKSSNVLSGTTPIEHPHTQEQINTSFGALYGEEYSEKETIILRESETSFDSIVASNISFSENSENVYLDSIDDGFTINNKFELPEISPNEDLLECLSKESDNGNVYAQHIVAYCYLSGILSEENKLKASAELYKKAAIAGLTQSKYCYAITVLQNKEEFDENDISQAKIILDEAVEDGHIIAIYFSAIEKLKTDPSTAISLLNSITYPNEDLKNTNILNALKNIADICRSNDRVYSKMKSHVDDYEKAITYGFSQAFFVLGYEYLSGKNVLRDVNKSFVLFKKAADLENFKACFELGYCYETGLGTQMNLEEANRWYDIAEKLAIACGWDMFDREHFKEIKNSMKEVND